MIAMSVKGLFKGIGQFFRYLFTPAGGSKRRAEQQAYEDRLDEAMKGHRPWRLSSATLVRLLSEVYVEAALSISARINLVYVPFFIIGELSVRMQQAERAVEQQLGGIALLKVQSAL